MKNTIFLGFFVFLVIAVILIYNLDLGGNTKLANEQIKQQQDPLSYDLKGEEIVVSQGVKPFDYTAEQLLAMSEECGNQQSKEYFQTIVDRFKSTQKRQFHFYHQEDRDDEYVVTLLPNVMGYSTLDEFKKDFDICAAGADAYPKSVNSNWLLFVNSCGSGVLDVGDTVNDCDMIRETVDPTLTLN